MKDFKDKIVAGIGSGTGAALASALASRGAHVAADVEMAAFGRVTRSLVEESGTNRFMSH